MRFTEDHAAFRTTVRDVVEREITPHVDAWEREGTFPAHELFPTLGGLACSASSTTPRTAARAPTTPTR